MRSAILHHTQFTLSLLKSGKYYGIASFFSRERYISDRNAVL